MKCASAQRDTSIICYFRRVELAKVSHVAKAVGFEHEDKWTNDFDCLTQVILTDRIRHSVNAGGLY